MTTPALNAAAAKRHAVAARTSGFTPPTQIDRQGAAKFAREFSSYFTGLRNAWENPSSNYWGYYLRYSLAGAGSKYHEFLDDLFHTTTGTP